MKDLEPSFTIGRRNFIASMLFMGSTADILIRKADRYNVHNTPVLRDKYKTLSHDQIITDLKNRRDIFDLLCIFAIAPAIGMSSSLIPWLNHFAQRNTQK